MQDFNRVEDPVIDQDNAKIIGALGGGYGAWKMDQKNIAKRPFLSRMIGKGAAPVLRPGKALLGAGLGTLAAGTLARYLNKENKEKHDVDMATAYGNAAMGGMNRYAEEKDYDDEKVLLKALALQSLLGAGSMALTNYGMQNESPVAVGAGAAGTLAAGVGGLGSLVGYGSKKAGDFVRSGTKYEKKANFQMPDYLPNTDEAVDQTVKGGMLGALASAILGTGLRRGATAGAIGNLGYNMYQKSKMEAKNQNDARTAYDQYASNYYDNQYGKYAHEKVAYRKLLASATKMMGKEGTKAAKKAAPKASSNMKSVRDAVAERAKKKYSNPNHGKYKSALGYELAKGM